MAITNGAGYQFIFGTKAQYDALVIAGKIVDGNLYFLTDTKQIYVGADLYTGQVTFVDEFPANPSQGIIYVNKATHESKVFNGADWDVIVPPIASDLVNANDTDLVNAKAIKDFITGGVGADAVNDVTYDAATQKFAVEYGDGTSSELALKNLFTDVAYDGATGNLTFVKANKAEGEEDLVINMPVENFLSAASYDADTHELTLTLEDGTEVKADLADLIDVYTVANTSSVELAMTGNEITAVVKVSATAGNILTLNEDGLFVPGDFIKSVADTATVALAVEGDELTANVKVSAEANNALVAKEDGLHVDVSGKADKADTLAGYGIGDAYTKDEVDAIAEGKADVADTLAGYGITDAYTKDEVDALFTWKEIGNV